MSAGPECVGMIAGRTTVAQDAGLDPVDRAIGIADEADDLSALDRIGLLVAARRGQVIFQAGDLSRHIFRVMSGLVRTSRRFADGRRQVVNFYLPNDFLGLGAPVVHHYSAEAIADTMLMAYARRSLEAFLVEQPHIGDALFRLLSRRLNDAQQRAVDLGRKTAAERIVSFLLGMAERKGATGYLELPMTRRDIADHLCLTVETVSRILARLQAERLIACLDARAIRLVDRAAMAARAEGRGALRHIARCPEAGADA